eukprot:m.51684 g.51684  ORF g.51684 m.51684 type:complete len:239 (-) comp21486_c0_seq1:387-1103(-)
MPTWMTLSGKGSMEVTPYLDPPKEQTDGQSRRASDHRNRCNHAYTITTSSSVETPTFIDVESCLANVDDLLLASPIREGRSYSLRLSMSPRSLLNFEHLGSTDHGDVLILPSEVLLLILEYLPEQSLVALRATCTSWKRVTDSHDTLIWKHRCLVNKWREPFVSSNTSTLAETTQDDVSRKWRQVYATHYKAKHSWRSNKVNEMGSSPWHPKKKQLHMDFSESDWGEIMETQLAGGPL